MPLLPSRPSEIGGLLAVVLASVLIHLRSEEQGDISTTSTATSRLNLITNPQLLIDVDDALVSVSSPAHTDGRSLDYERCARLHNYLVAYGAMAHHQRDAQDLNELLNRPSFFERPRDDPEILRNRLDVRLNFLLRVHHHADAE
jgi:hypothetical protein